MRREIIEAHLAAVAASAPDLEVSVAAAAALVRDSLEAGGAVVALGNGGSAAQAQHLVAEMTGRYLLPRPGLRAVALTADPVALTAIANDFGYVEVFARQVEAVARPGDVVVAISTSGSSPNVVRAADAARTRGCRVVALTGARSCPLGEAADVWIRVASDEVARVQEVHLLAIHGLVEVLEGSSGGGA